MLQRVALVLFLVLIAAATAIFAAGHFGVRLPWEVAVTDDDTPRDTSSQDRDRTAAVEADAPASSAVDQAGDAAATAIDEATTALGTAPDAAPPAGGVAVDISRISPDGPSVFAGRAEPDTYVTVLENGKPTGTVKADSNGDWSLATEHKFASTDADITYETSRTPPPAPEPPPPVAKAEPAPPAAAAVAGDVMRKFEKLVADARDEAAKQREAAEAATPSPPAAEPEADVAAAAPDAVPPGPTASEEASADAAATPDGATSAATGTGASDAGKSASTTAAGASGDNREATASPTAPEPAAPEPERKTADVTRSTPEPAAPDVIPVPIMFVYNEATLTSEGQRAADLLLEYLLLKRLAVIELTGHADERGTEAYNFDLSRDRLEAVSQILRAGGYSGDLKLTPKGKTEPFMGVDRAAFRGEALYQLDRRVELRVTR